MCLVLLPLNLYVVFLGRKSVSLCCRTPIASERSFISPKHLCNSFSGQKEKETENKKEKQRKKETENRNNRRTGPTWPAHTARGSVRRAVAADLVGV
jgi:hypothetical protein